MSRPFADEPLLRQTPTFVFSRSRDEATGRGLLRVTARAPHSASVARLRDAAEGHRAISHPHVARVWDADLDAPHPTLRFDIDAVADGEDVVARIAAHRDPLPFDAATGFIDAYASALVTAHATVSSITGRPLCLGVVGWPCFLFDTSGHFALVGFGAPLALERSPLSPGAFAAPDVVAGAAVTPGADVLAFTLMQRASLSLVALPEALSRVFASAPTPDDLRLASSMAAANFRLFVGSADRRPSADAMRALLHRTWRRLGVTPDLARYREIVGGYLRDATPTVLRVARDGAWFEFGASQRVSLSRRAALRRVLEALTRATNEGAPSVSVAALVSAGWPGERMRVDSGAARVYVALSTLRRLGLSDAIERYDEGYRVRPDVRVERV